MKAILLNSGRGTRLGELTTSKPKGMVEVGGKPMVGWQLDRLREAGVKDVIITTGPFPEQIRDYVAKDHSDMNVTYVHSDKFRETNYIYSLILTREHIDDDLLVMHGDIIFGPGLLPELLAHESQNVSQVNVDAPLPEKDFKGRIEGGILTEIGVRVKGEGAVFLMPVYKLSKESMHMWLDLMEDAFSQGYHKIYPEDLLPQIAQKLQIAPHHYDGICQEIDDHEDLALVEQLLQQQD